MVGDGRVDYGYAADWRVEQIALAVEPDVYDRCKGLPEIIMQAIHSERNTVRQMSSATGLPERHSIVRISARRRGSASQTRR